MNIALDGRMRTFGHLLLLLLLFLFLLLLLLLLRNATERHGRGGSRRKEIGSTQSSRTPSAAWLDGRSRCCSSIGGCSCSTRSFDTTTTMTGTRQCRRCRRYQSLLDLTAILGVGTGIVHLWQWRLKARHVVLIVGLAGRLVVVMVVIRHIHGLFRSRKRSKDDGDWLLKMRTTMP
jgi:hypothetical protein